MTHYETLGVPIDSSPDSIKTAYRRKAKQHHPDKDGGDHKAMADLNKAYDTLSDPEKRAHYDKTGSDVGVTSVQAMARSILIQAFSATLEQGDANPVAAAIRNVVQGLRQAESHKKQIEEKIKLLNKHSGKVTVSKGDNLYQSLIDQQTQKLTEQLSGVSNAIEALNLARRNADMYLFTEPDEYVEELHIRVHDVFRYTTVSAS